jgi:flavin-binding protein dodecin
MAAGFYHPILRFKVGSAGDAQPPVQDVVSIPVGDGGHVGWDYEAWKRRRRADESIAQTLERLFSEMRGDLKEEVAEVIAEKLEVHQDAVLDVNWAEVAQDDGLVEQVARAYQRWVEDEEDEFLLLL